MTTGIEMIPSVVIILISGVNVLIAITRFMVLPKRVLRLFE